MRHLSLKREGNNPGGGDDNGGDGVAAGDRDRNLSLGLIAGSN